MNPLALPLAVQVPLAMVVVSVLIAALSTAGARHRARRAAAQPPDPARYLVHAINDDRCTGCEACVSACPTNVLALVSHKSRVLRFQDCVQCEACSRACPTTALVMHPLGTTPPSLRLPDLDRHFQTRVPGQYLIGEVAGKPLVKNAANLGRVVIEHIVAGGLDRAAPADVDVAIVGSGPGGLSAALTCIHHGLSYVLLEKEQIAASTVARYPKGKPFMAEPADADNLSFLPVFDASKEELVETWKRTVELAGVEVRRGEPVESIARGGDVFRVVTPSGSYAARRVVLAVGTRGKPRTLGIPGEQQPHVFSDLDDPDDYAGQPVLVVGGGDSALEAALALARAGASVTLAYRGRAFGRAQKKNRDAVEAAAAAGTMRVLLQTSPVEIQARDVVLAVADGQRQTIPSSAVFVLIGADLPRAWLGRLGVEFVERPHAHELGATDQLVRELVPDAAPCPRDAAEAARRATRVPEPHDRTIPDAPPVAEWRDFDDTTRIWLPPARIESAIEHLYVG